ncbi:hypothetical protein D9M73_128270 [compost metagenome]
MREVGGFEFSQVQRRLRPDHLELLAFALHPGRAGLGADTYPVDACRRGNAAVGFNRNLEAARMQRRNQCGIDLQQGLAARHHDKSMGLVAGWPLRLDPVGQRPCIAELAAQGAVSTDKIGIAKLADGSGPVLLSAGPQVATGKTAEHGRPARIGAFALQGVKNFLDLVAHAALPGEWQRRKDGGIKLAATNVKRLGAARFLYMVVLYMAPIR